MLNLALIIELKLLYKTQIRLQTDLQVFERSFIKSFSDQSQIVVLLFYLLSLGTCVDMVNNYSCQCQPGYTGYNCSFEIDECQSSPCINGNNML